jgi:hypothetical protein
MLHKNVPDTGNNSIWRGGSDPSLKFVNREFLYERISTDCEKDRI